MAVAVAWFLLALPIRTSGKGKIIPKKNQSRQGRPIIARHVAEARSTRRVVNAGKKRREPFLAAAGPRAAAGGARKFCNQEVFTSGIMYANALSGVQSSFLPATLFKKGAPTI